MSVDTLVHLLSYFGGLFCLLSNFYHVGIDCLHSRIILFCCNFVHVDDGISLHVILASWLLEKGWAFWYAFKSWIPGHACTIIRSRVIFISVEEEWSGSLEWSQPLFTGGAFQFTDWQLIHVQHALQCSQESQALVIFHQRETTGRWRFLCAMDAANITH